jgi:3-isopropylmalate dehydratase small subunit
MNRGLQHVEYELYRNGKTWYSLTAFYKGYGFSLEIMNVDTEEIVFKKFLKTQDTDYCGNYLRKVVRNNFGATIA